MKIVALVGFGGIYGYGHFYRILNLKNCLRRHEIEMKIIFKWPDDSIDLAGYSAFILDKRDVSFPKEIVYKGMKRIAMDNRGTGRCQAHLKIDTLPHYDMNIHDLKQSLRHIMLHEFLTKKPSKLSFSYLKYLPGRRSGLKKNLTCDPLEYKKLIHIKTEPYHLDLQLEYLKKLGNLESIDTYFGQTLFEAIYLGKRVSLYGISPYHRRLSEWFLRRWNTLLSPGLYFDGKGLWRVSERVREFLHEHPGESK